MILYNNQKPLKIIGYEQSTLTQEAGAHFAEDGLKSTVITPEDFIKLENLHDYQYIIAFSKDRDMVMQCIAIIEDEQLNAPSYIHPTVKLWTEPKKFIGPGVGIGPYSLTFLHCEFYGHTILESTCLVSHYTTIGKGVIMHSGTYIAGKVTVGNNCEFGFRSTVIDNLTIADEVRLGAVSTLTKNASSGFYVGTPSRRIGDFNA